ncbi:protein rhomboid isoform X2 [Dendroctonus ponderosae]|uniref:Peptidase S54 rhomboid domain-containing protein n=1 Tax=Dendroctonus ponderosae TaxID=77166 RepID=U4UCQ9_DENPD|nr:protein rhomboid isoform X2 [Dendroctonus ponderosae]ERL88356.1 hypothetical protein D910_05743 [Dendroctonus ponderosae]
MQNSILALEERLWSCKMERKLETKIPIEAASPLGTLESSMDAENVLVKPCSFNQTCTRQKPKWHTFRVLPIAILTVSSCQIGFHLYSTPSFNKLLRFEPNKRLEVWRYFTYMLVHDGWSHLALNVVMQCIFAALLEISQGRLRVLTIYVLGGVTGILGAACLHPDLVVGASAGGYSLLLSNVADLVLNFHTINYRIYRAISISTLIIFDVIYDIVHIYSSREPQVSWQAHFFGGLTGLFLGLVVFKCNKPTKSTRVFFCLGLTLYFIFIASFIVLMAQIEKCGTKGLIRRQFVYLC